MRIISNGSRLRQRPWNASCLIQTLRTLFCSADGQVQSPYWLEKEQKCFVLLSILLNFSFSDQSSNLLCGPSCRMACFTRLKEDIKFLESTFTRKHDCFQVLSASVDEIACRFIGKNGERIVIHANITVSHPIGLFSYKVALESVFLSF